MPCLLLQPTRDIPPPTHPNHTHTHTHTHLPKDEQHVSAAQLPPLYRQPVQLIKQRAVLQPHVVWSWSCCRVNRVAGVRRQSLCHHWPCTDCVSTHRDVSLLAPRQTHTSYAGSTSSTSCARPPLSLIGLTECPSSGRQLACESACSTATSCCACCSFSGEPAMICLVRVVCAGGRQSAGMRTAIGELRLRCSRVRL
jgi:hypothetical protein